MWEGGSRASSNTLDTTLRWVSEQTCVEQQGFVRGRLGHYKFLSLRVTMELFPTRLPPRPARLFSDQAQALASVFHAPRWDALRGHGGGGGGGACCAPHVAGLVLWRYG